MSSKCVALIRIKDIYSHEYVFFLQLNNAEPGILGGGPRGIFMLEKFRKRLKSIRD